MTAASLSMCIYSTNDCTWYNDFVVIIHFLKMYFHPVYIIQIWHNNNSQSRYYVYVCAHPCVKFIPYMYM